MNIQDFYDFLVREEAYDASSLNCFAFRHGYDVKTGLPLSLGNMVRGYQFDCTVLNGKHINILVRNFLLTNTLLQHE